MVKWVIPETTIQNAFHTHVSPDRQILLLVNCFYGLQLPASQSSGEKVKKGLFFMFIIAIPGGRVVWIVGPSQHVTFLTLELFYKHPFPSYILP